MRMPSSRKVLMRHRRAKWGRYCLVTLRNWAKEEKWEKHSRVMRAKRWNQDVSEVLSVKWLLKHVQIKEESVFHYPHLICHLLFSTTNPPPNELTEKKAFALSRFLSNRTSDTAVERRPAHCHASSAVHISIVRPQQPITVQQLPPLPLCRAWMEALRANLNKPEETPAA